MYTVIVRNCEAYRPLFTIPDALPSRFICGATKQANLAWTSTLSRQAPCPANLHHCWEEHSPKAIGSNLHLPGQRHFLPSTIHGDFIGAISTISLLLEEKGGGSGICDTSYKHVKLSHAILRPLLLSHSSCSSRSAPRHGTGGLKMADVQK